MPADSVHVATVRKAIVTAGGVGELALRIGVAPPIIGAWLAGRIAMPTAYFLKLVDIVMNDQFPEQGVRQPNRDEARLP